MIDAIQKRVDFYEKFDKENGTKHHVLYMEPDYDALLWEGDTVICGGDSDGFCFEDSPDDINEKNAVNLEPDPEAVHWLYDFYEYCLNPLNTEDISREDLFFDWENFHLQGLQIALRIAQQLPDNCELWYTTPYEDASRTLPNAILIKKASDFNYKLNA